MSTNPANFRRDLFRGSLEVLLLALLSDGPRHGYQLSQKLAAATGETLGPGTLYPLLHRLEAQGWTTHHPSAFACPSTILSTSQGTSQGTSGGGFGGRGRKTYTLTPAGEARLKSAAAEWQAAIARMQSLVLPALRQTVQHPKSTTTTVPT